MSRQVQVQVGGASTVDVSNGFIKATFPTGGDADSMEASKTRETVGRLMSRSPPQLLMSIRTINAAQHTTGHHYISLKIRVRSDSALTWDLWTGL